MKLTDRFAYALAALFCAGMLAGCGSGTPSGTSAAVPNLSGNWQFQAGPAATGSTVVTGPLLLGALTSSGTQVTGSFRYTNLAQYQACGLNQTIALTGSIDATSRVLTLTSGTLPTGGGVLSLSLVVPSVPNSFASGTVQIAGAASICNLAQAAIGIQIAPVTGTYTGTLFPGLPGSTTTTGSGPATLQLTQASTPQLDGQFPVTGTVQYAVGGCSATTTLTGTASGVGLTLRSPAATTGLSATNIFATVDPTAATLSIEALTASGSCAGAMPASGTLNRQ